MGKVFPIDHYKINLVLRDQLCNRCFHSFTAGLSKSVTKKKDLHRDTTSVTLSSRRTVTLICPGNRTSFFNLSPISFAIEETPWSETFSLSTNTRSSLPA